ncbi:MAG: DUF1566 domain-containing protein [Deltaproteobacteria bacterium]|nr:DUF1566 domain-containing protein [Deltaproteobacteria bacterium]
MKRILIVAGAAVVLVGSWAWAAAPGGRYTVGTETVTDNKTGLIWQRTVPSQSYSKSAGRTYCQTLNLGGFSTGWRLPEKEEMETLVDVRAVNPNSSIDQTAFPNTPNFARFWTSTPYARNGLRSWTIEFGTGSTGNYEDLNAYRVRCVR